MDIPTDEQLIERIDAFLERHGMAPSRFGREATGEPQLLSSIRDGRSPSLKTVQRIASFMAEKDSKLTPEAEVESSGKAGDVSGSADRMVA